LRPASHACEFGCPSRWRLGWNLASRVGRIWYTMKIAPAPEKIGRKCAPAKFERIRSGADHVICGIASPIMTGWLGWASEASEKPLKKQLAGPLTAPHLCEMEFRFDSLATV